VKFVVAFGRFWWDFVVGDEWRIALGVGVVTTLGLLLAAWGAVDGRVIALAVGATLMLTVSAVILVSGRRSDGREAR
jgi:hypothetical protein